MLTGPGNPIIAPVCRQTCQTTIWPKHQGVIAHPAVVSTLRASLYRCVVLASPAGRMSRVVSLWLERTLWQAVQCTLLFVFSVSILFPSVWAHVQQAEPTKLGVAWMLPSWRNTPPAHLMAVHYLSQEIQGFMQLTPSQWVPMPPDRGYSDTSVCVNRDLVASLKLILPPYTWN